ncbi:MAG: DUF1194 domain-containing protein [Aestuariivirga sp.]
MASPAGRSPDGVRRFLYGVLAAGLVLASPVMAQSPGTYDLALVLAVDCSGSVDGGEFKLQIDGIAAAFRDDEVIAAALAGPHRRIAVTVMSWGDPDYPKFTTGWFEINSPAAAESFAGTVSGFGSRTGGGTGIGIAIAYGITLIETSGFISVRKVIDVSGDGVESYEIRPPKFLLKNAQLMRAKAGVVVNGLAIRNEIFDLDQYYRDEVAAGPGSFVVDISDYRDFPEAIKLKLLREILPLTASLEP